MMRSSLGKTNENDEIWTGYVTIGWEELHNEQLHHVHRRAMRCAGHNKR